MAKRSRPSSPELSLHAAAEAKATLAAPAARAGLNHSRTRDSVVETFFATPGHVSCAAILEFEDRAIEELREAVAARYGFEVASHTMELYGTCSGCLSARRSKGLDRHRA